MPALHIAIIIGGIISLLVANGHRTFYVFFGWRKTFQKLTILESKVFYTVHLFLIPIFLLFAYLSFFHTQELAEVSTPLGRDLLIFYSLFWLCRGIWQIIYFGRFLKEDPKRAYRMNAIVLTASISSMVIYAAPIAIKFMK